MKRVLLLVAVMAAFLMSSCNKTKEQSSNDFTENETTSNQMSVIIDSVECTYQYVNDNCARVITSKMMLDSAFLRKTINELKVTENIVYFHIPELSGSGEEYASCTGKNIFVYQHPPKTRADVDAIKEIDNMASNMSDLEVLNMNKELEYGGISGYLETISNAALAYNNHKDSDNKRVKEQSKRLLNKLKATQIAVFPKLRKLFAQESKNRLWEENITVTHTGRTISFTGYIYANNKNIKESYEAIAGLLSKLRFSKANFRWSESDGYTYYTINSPADGVIVGY